MCWWRRYGTGKLGDQFALHGRHAPLCWLNQLPDGQSPAVLKACQFKYPLHLSVLLPQGFLQSHRNALTPHRAGNLMSQDNPPSVWHRSQGHIPYAFVLPRDSYKHISHHSSEGPHRMEQQSCTAVAIQSCTHYCLFCSFLSFPPPLVLLLISYQISSLLSSFCLRLGF